MALRFRNIEATPATPVAEWGVEGILTAIERGSLPHWRALVAAVRAEPHGVVARDLEAALAVAAPSGIVDLLRSVLADSPDGAKAEVARRMRRAVRRTHLSLRQFAPLIGTSHSRLSTYLTGAVTPSAATLLETEAAAAQIARRRPAATRGPAIRQEA